MMSIDTDDAHSGWEAQKGMNPKHITTMNKNNNNTTTENPESNAQQELVATRRKCLKCFKSNTRVFDDYSIEVTPQAMGEPSQLEVKKVGKSKRYVTNGKNPLACIELKVPADVPDRAAAFFHELDRLTKDIQTSKPELPQGKLKLNIDNLKVYHDDATGEAVAWMCFSTQSSIPISSQLAKLLGIINQCFATNKKSTSRQSL